MNPPRTPLNNLLRSYLPTPDSKSGRPQSVYSPKLHSMNGRYSTPLQDRRVYKSPTTPFLGTPEMLIEDSKSREDEKYESFMVDEEDGGDVDSKRSSLVNEEDEIMNDPNDQEDNDSKKLPNRNKKKKKSNGISTIKSPDSDTIQKIRRSYFDNSSSQVAPPPPVNFIQHPKKKVISINLPKRIRNVKIPVKRPELKTTGSKRKKKKAPKRVQKEVKSGWNPKTALNRNFNTSIPLRKSRNFDEDEDDDDEKDADFVIDDSELYKAASSSSDDEEDDEMQRQSERKLRNSSSRYPSRQRRSRMRKSKSSSSSSQEKRRKSLKQQSITDLKKSKSKKSIEYRKKKKKGWANNRSRFSRKNLIESVKRIDLTEEKMKKLLGSSGKPGGGAFSLEATKVLKKWFIENRLEPYPKAEEKEILEKKTGLTIHQINDWFTNKRKRIWKPFVENETRKKKGL